MERGEKGSITCAFLQSNSNFFLISTFPPFKNSCGILFSKEEEREEREEEREEGPVLPPLIRIGEENFKLFFENEKEKKEKKKRKL